MLTPDGYYIQEKGLAMESPLSSILANAWLRKFEQRFRAMDSKFFFRYVDDICMAVHKDVMTQILETINSWHKNLDFTLEEENDKGELAFLDIRIIHKNNKLESTWYTKPTSNGLTLNYHSLSHMMYKKSVIRSLTHRIYNSCSNGNNFHDSMEKAR